MRWAAIPLASYIRTFVNRSQEKNILSRTITKIWTPKLLSRQELAQNMALQKNKSEGPVIKMVLMLPTGQSQITLKLYHLSKSNQNTIMSQSFANSTEIHACKWNLISLKKESSFTHSWPAIRSHKTGTETLLLKKDHAHNGDMIIKHHTTRLVLELNSLFGKPKLAGSAGPILI